MQQLEILHIRKGELRMYQAIIIDDEQWVIKSLIATIEDQEYFEIVGEFY